MWLEIEGVSVAKEYTLAEMHHLRKCEKQVHLHINSKINDIKKQRAEKRVSGGKRYL